MSFGVFRTYFRPPPPAQARQLAYLTKQPTVVSPVGLAAETDVALALTLAVVLPIGMAVSTEEARSRPGVEIRIRAIGDVPRRRFRAASRSRSFR